jgi:hypothetical protein
MKCGVKNLWEGKQKCSCCVNWIEEYPDDVEVNPEATEAVQQYALIVRNKKSHGSTGKAMMIHTIIVQSPLLKPLLEEVFEGYEGITATLKKGREYRELEVMSRILIVSAYSHFLEAFCALFLPLAAVQSCS